MKKGWEIKRLPEIAEYFIGLTYSPKDVSNKGTIVLRSSNIQNDQLDLSDLVRVARSVKEGLMVRKGDILMCSRNGSKRLVGKTALIGNLPEEMTFGTFMTVIRGKPNPYLAWFFKSDAFREQIGVGENTMINQITKYMLDVIHVPFPPPAEQQRIVGLLDEAFAGLATAKANAEKNLENARALLGSHLREVFSRGRRHPLVEIGEVGQVFDGPHATPKTVDAGPIFLGISALNDGKINLAETRHVTAEDFQRWTRRVRPEADDVVFSYETRLGQAAIIPRGLDCCLGRRMGLVRLNRRRVSPRFFVYQYISPPYREFLSSRIVRGATVDRISLKEFPSFPIYLPSLDKQERMADQVDSLGEEVQRLESIYRRKVEALGALKKSLLHKAFRGQL